MVATKHTTISSALKTNGTAIAIASMFSDLEDGGKEVVTAI